jgi:hypothetical protein
MVSNGPKVANPNGSNRFWVVTKNRASVWVSHEFASFMPGLKTKQNIMYNRLRISGCGFGPVPKRDAKASAEKRRIRRVSGDKPFEVFKPE